MGKPPAPGLNQPEPSETASTPVSETPQIAKSFPLPKCPHARNRSCYKCRPDLHRPAAWIRANKKEQARRDKHLGIPPERPQPSQAADEQPHVLRRNRLDTELAEHLRTLHDSLQRDVIEDLGGAAGLSTIRRALVTRLADIDTVVNLLKAEITRTGILTVKGQVRSTVEALFKAVDRFDRLANRVGLDRKKVEPKLTLESLSNELSEIPGPAPAEPWPTPDEPQADDIMMHEALDLTAALRNQPATLDDVMEDDDE